MSCRSSLPQKADCGHCQRIRASQQAGPAGAPVTAVDPDPGDVLSYYLVGTDARFFDIVPEDRHAAGPGGPGLRDPGYLLGDCLRP